MTDASGQAPVSSFQRRPRTLRQGTGGLHFLASWTRLNRGFAVAGLTGDGRARTLLLESRMRTKILLALVVGFALPVPSVWSEDAAAVQPAAGVWRYFEFKAAS